jgi:hypothetical protein
MVGEGLMRPIRICKAATPQGVEMAKTIYERMASSAMATSRTYSEGDFPQRVWWAEFVYANGLVARHDGKKWEVVREEKMSAR